MPVRLKKLIGTVLLVVLIAVYALLATIIAVAHLWPVLCLGTACLFLLYRLFMDFTCHVSVVVDGTAAQSPINHVPHPLFYQITGCSAALAGCLNHRSWRCPVSIVDTVLAQQCQFGLYRGGIVY